MSIGLENFILVSANLQLPYCPSYRSIQLQIPKDKNCLKWYDLNSLRFLEAPTKAIPKYDQIVEPW